jgi:hypothetical protein
MIVPARTFTALNVVPGKHESKWPRFNGKKESAQKREDIGARQVVESPTEIPSSMENVQQIKQYLQFETKTCYRENFHDMRHP